MKEGSAISTEPTPETGDNGAGRAGRLAINEDWAATIVGLLLLALVLVGAIPGWLVP